MDQRSMYQGDQRDQFDKFGRRPVVSHATEPRARRTSIIVATPAIAIIIDILKLFNLLRSTISHAVARILAQAFMKDSAGKPLRTG